MIQPKTHTIEQPGASRESGKGTTLLPLPPLRTGLDGFHHPAQAVCKPCVSRAGGTHRTTVGDACWLT
jgi:hypothetical protein